MEKELDTVMISPFIFSNLNFKTRKYCIVVKIIDERKSHAVLVK